MSETDPTAVDVELSYIEQGQGHPVVLVPGWPASGAMWRDQITALAPSFRVFAPDLPGFGATPPISRHLLKDHAAALKAWLDRQELGPTCMVGWSMGAGVLMSYAAQFGCSTVSGLVLVDDSPRLKPAPDWRSGRDTTFAASTTDRWFGMWERGERRQVLEELTPLGYADPTEHADQIVTMVEDGLRADPVAALESFKDALECDFRAAVASIVAPTLLVYGAESKMTTPANRAFMQQAIANATLRVFSKSGHSPMFEEPDRFNAELIEFIRSLPESLP